MLRHFIFPAAALFGFAVSAPAQSGIGDALVFTGLTTTAGPETYAWLTWNPTKSAKFDGRVLAVYRKTGNAAEGNPFTRISVIQPVGDTRLISSLLPVSQKVGQDLTELDTMLDDLLGDAMAAPTITVSEKITALLVGSLGNEEQTRRVHVLALQHPAIALCAGLALADKIPAAGAMTYELREFDQAADADLGVIGRVTVDPATPSVLPAPGAAVEVPDATAKGNVNTSLRWPTPNALRDVSPLHHGFNLYRVPKAVAEAHGWQTSVAPTAAALAAEPQAKRVNHFPILPQKMLSAAEAADPADITTTFATDDNGRYQPAGIPFTDNARFYYFVAARDLLGRSGQPSVGTLVTIYDRLPPNPPRHTRVSNLPSYNGSVRDQRFLVEWDAPELPPSETVSAWYVYRWRTPNEIPSKSRQLNPVTLKPERNLIAILPVATRSFTDDGTTAPPPWAIVDEPAPDAADHGKTYFYTIRAADGSLSANLSGNSAPAWGVLRDRSGPVATNGTVNVTTIRPQVTFISHTQVPLAGLTKDQAHFFLTCESTHAKGLEGAEFRYVPSGQITAPVPLGRAHFTRNAAGNLIAALRRTVIDLPPETVLECRVTTTAGIVSPWTPGAGTPNPEAGKFILAKWNAALIRATTEGSLTDWKHETGDPLTGTSTTVTGSFIPPADAKEYRIYRRVDDSAQSLITQGPIVASPTIWTDSTPLATSATVEYFLQTYDANSNSSPLVTQGAPLTVIAPSLPTPMLEPLVSLLPLINAKTRVKWFCSTAGVERFEIWVARKSGGLPSSVGSGLSADLAAHPNMDTTLAETAGLDFSVYQTGVTRLLSVGGTPEFEAVLPVSTSDTYTVMVRAVGIGEYPARAVGAFSNVEDSTYSIRVLAQNQPVPWPDRALPPQADFHPGVAATYLSSNELAPWKGNGVRIGEYEDAAHDGSTTSAQDDTGVGGLVFRITGTRPASQYLFKNDAVAAAEPLEPIPGVILPVVLYRVQIANTNFPNVPGDVVQVSPLMEQVAYTPFGLSKISVTDPFVAVLHKSDNDLPRTATNFDHDILLLDRQPVIKGARYKYLLVRFTPGKEIERVIVTNTVDVPLSN